MRSGSLPSSSAFLQPFSRLSSVNGFATTCTSSNDSNPLKKARLRQYLLEGLERSYMPAMAEAIPAILHVSLFLFLMGYCEDVFGLHIAIDLSTILPIVLTCLLYILTTVAPIIYPQSPYQTSFSGLIWRMRQRFWWPPIQGSGLQWNIEVCESGHGAGTDATCDGRDGGSQRTR
jgi:hypothetical protein